MKVSELLEKKPRLFKGIIYSIVKDPLATEDIFQELCLKGHVHKIEAEVAFPWLLTVTRNLCFDHLRRLKKKKRRFVQILPPRDDAGDEFGGDDADQFGDAFDDPAEAVLSRERLDIVTKAINALPEKQRVAFWARVNGRSFRDIAGDTGEPLGTILARVHSARQSLQRSLVNA